MKREYVTEIISLLFILLFVYAGLVKLADFQKFKIQLGQSPLLTAFAGWIVWIVPLTEILISITLIVPRFRLFGLYAAFSLMVMFTFYIIAILNFSTYIPCSCGGVLERLEWSEHLLLNIIFVLLGVTGIFIQTRIQNGKVAILKQK